MERLIDYVLVFLISASPIFELRLGIPYGLFVLKLSVVETFIFSFLGNLIPVFFIMKYLPALMDFLFKHFPFLHKHAEKYFLKLHKKHSERINEIGGLALMTFVAIPIPGTGAWTGAILAYILNLPKKFAIPAIALGLICAAVIVILFSDTIAWVGMLLRTK